MPKIFYETGAVGKEPVMVLVGTDPIEVAREMIEIARRLIADPDSRDESEGACPRGPPLSSFRARRRPGVLPLRPPRGGLCAAHSYSRVNG